MKTELQKDNSVLRKLSRVLKLILLSLGMVVLILGSPLWVPVAWRQVPLYTYVWNMRSLEHPPGSKRVLTRNESAARKPFTEYFVCEIRQYTGSFAEAEQFYRRQLPAKWQNSKTDSISVERLDRFLATDSNRSFYDFLFEDGIITSFVPSDHYLIITLFANSGGLPY
jgi:hypothetical protein